MADISKITVVIGVRPLPNTFNGRNNKIEDIVAEACREAKDLYDNGIRSIMVQNVNDSPAYTTAPVPTIAYMSVIMNEIKRTVGPDCRLGISILRNDTPGCIAVASAAGLDFVRAKVFVGEMMKMEREIGNMNECLEMKKTCNCDCEIWADIHDRNGVPIGGTTLLQDCGFALRGGAKSLIISGSSYLNTIELIKEVKGKFPKAEVIIGGGANVDNIGEMMKVADGVIIASSLKVDGKISNPVDPERAKAFIEAFRKA